VDRLKHVPEKRGAQVPSDYEYSAVLTADQCALLRQALASRISLSPRCDTVRTAEVDQSDRCRRMKLARITAISRR
jgi:hypothetical protein